MIEKLERYIREEDGVKISCPPDNIHIISKINELVDAVNGILDYAPLEMAMKAEPKTRPENVQQVSYMAPGDITVFHGFNCSVEFDTPLPKGTRITIKSITKGGDNE